MKQPYDVVIVGGGPGGLSAALALGRARKNVLVCDSGPRRNAAAVHVQNFLTRDGTPPSELRRIGREQLAEYPSVTVQDIRVESISGTRGAFHVATSGGSGNAGPIEARRILLCTGMIDEMLPIKGFRELWGHAVFQCPYCHGWEVRDRVWGYLGREADASHLLPFALMIRGWTPNVVVFTNGGNFVPEESRARLEAAGIRLETAPISRLVRARESDQQLESIELEGADASNSSTVVPIDVLFVHPPQRQVDLVRALNIALDDDGYVRVDPMKRETSVPGIYAAGDLTQRMQGAIISAAAGMQTAGMINVDLMMDPSRV